LNKSLTIVFLNAILKRTGRNTNKEVTFINHEVGGAHKEDKTNAVSATTLSSSISLPSFYTLIT